MRRSTGLILVVGLFVFLGVIAVATSVAQQKAPAPPAPQPPPAASKLVPIMATPSFLKKGEEYTFYTTTKGKMKGEVEEVTAYGWIKVAFESDFDKKPIWMNLSQVAFIHEHRSGEKDND